VPVFLNQRSESPPEKGKRLARKVSILVEFPTETLEAIVVQWETCRPTVLVQLKRDPKEPLQFPGKRADVPGNSEMRSDHPLSATLDFHLHSFLDPASGRVFGREAFNADLVFSARAFSHLQPEPDLVLPETDLWECRLEALNALQISDVPGIAPKI